MIENNVAFSKIKKSLVNWDRIDVILCWALAIRISLIIVGNLLDKYSSSIQYTDIDYFIFSDAASLMNQGLSPYERSTYRYPPVIAWLLLPNKYNRSFGKLVFSAADVGVVYQIFKIMSIISLENEEKKMKFRSAMLWAFNPIAINICTRGSADSLINLLILSLISFTLHNNIFMSAVTLGFSIYFRLYPIIYFPAILYYFYKKYEINEKITENPPNERKEMNLHYRKNMKMFKFIILVFGTCLGLMTISYYFYGDIYLSEAVFYHFSRSDHRHNFSPHFYWIYLSKSESIKNSVSNYDIYLNFLPELIKPMFLLLQKLILFTPQCILFLLLVVKFAENNLPLCFLFQTMIFVTFNKVITAQYFTWYLSLIPLSSHIFISIPTKIFGFITILWCTSLGFWLYHAYNLEFLGINNFFVIWVASCWFFVTNVILIYMLIIHSKRNLLPDLKKIE